jgi:hypothetical protein
MDREELIARKLISRSKKLTTHLHLAPSLRMRGIIAHSPMRLQELMPK